MILLLSLFISVPTWAVDRDCALSDGYIWDHLGKVTDNCDYECGWAQCGYICIHAEAGKECYCGEERIDIYNGQYYCCVDHSPDNRTQCSVLTNGYGYCPQGRVSNKGRDTCNNHCYNDYQTSAVAGRWSQYRCGTDWGRCMWVSRFMCRGYSVCLDSRDVRECDEDLKCVQGYRPSKGVLVSDLTGSHYYCDYEQLHNDGQYDTITREDETDLNILSRKVHINYTSITECTNNAESGLMCGEECVANRNWCRENALSSCGKYNFTTTNKQLCANTRFWAGKTCNRFYTSGRKAAEGRRCTGAMQHCVYPWYTSSIYAYEVQEVLGGYKTPKFLFSYFIFFSSDRSSGSHSLRVCVHP